MTKRTENAFMTLQNMVLTARRRNWITLDQSLEYTQRLQAFQREMSAFIKTKQKTGHPPSQANLNHLFEE